MFEQIQERIKDYNNKQLQLSEESTKQSLILPMLQEQGFNIFDLDEVKPEYVSDMRSNGAEKVDYAILVDGKPVIFIEAKPLGTQLEKHIGQLQRYYVSDKEVKYGVLTDGQYYWFFADDERENIMDEKPFYKIDLLNLLEIDLEYLNLFTKESIKDIAKVEQQRDKLKLKYFIENNIKRPDKDFLEYISKRVGLTVELAEIERLLGKNNKVESKIIKTKDIDKVVDTNNKEITNNKVEKVSTETKNIDKVVNTNNKEITNNKLIDNAIKSDNRQVPDKPNNYNVFGQDFIFESWRETVINILNIVITRDKKSYESIKQIANTTNMLIGKTKEEVDKGYNSYSIKELVNGDFVSTNMSSKTTKQMINKILSETKLSNNIITYNY